MSDANRQHVHRQQSNGQDEHAANGGPDPSFCGLVHATVAAVKRRGGHCMRFLGHWFRPLGSVELCSLSERHTIKLRKTPALKCRSFMKSIALTYATPAKRKDTWQSKRSIRAITRWCKRLAAHIHGERTKEPLYPPDACGWSKSASPPQDATIEPCGPCFNMTGICFQ